MATNKKAITGRNIYTDRRGRTIYYDTLSKKGYVVNSKDEGKFYLYKNRYIFIILLMILGADFFPSWIYCLGAGIIAAIVGELYFRFKILANLRIVEQVNRNNRRTLLQSIIETNNKKQTLIKVFLYTAFSILIILNAYVSKVSTAILILSIILCIGALYYALTNIIAITKMDQGKR